MTRAEIDKMVRLLEEGRRYVQDTSQLMQVVIDRIQRDRARLHDLLTRVQSALEKDG